MGISGSGPVAVFLLQVVFDRGESVVGVAEEDEAEDGPAYSLDLSREFARSWLAESHSRFSMSEELLIAITEIALQSC